MNLENQLVLNNCIDELSFANGHLKMRRLPTIDNLYNSGDKVWVIYRNIFDLCMVSHRDNFERLINKSKEINQKCLFSFEEAVDMVGLNIRWYKENLNAKDLDMLCKKYLAANTNQVDRKDAKRVVDLIKQNKLKEAYDVHCSCDTFVREGMPTRLVVHILPHETK